MQRMTIEQYNDLVGSKKKSKYGNKKTVYNGFTYDSKKEAAYAQELDLRVRAGDIHSWERQVPLEIKVNDRKICKYIADFLVKYANGKQEFVDVKGMKTDVYRLKKKLVEAIYGITIIEH